MTVNVQGVRVLVVLGILLGPNAGAIAAPPGCAFEAQTSVRIGNGGRIDGDVAANDVGGTVHLGRRVVLADDTTVAGDAVELVNGTSVFDVAANALDRARGVSVRGAVSTVTLPLAAPFCDTPPVECGGAVVRVEKNGSTPLTPGTYGQVVVENGGTLVLSAGTYAFCGLRTGRHVTIAIGGGVPTTIGVAGDLVLENGSTLGPGTGAPLPSIVVAGERLKIGADARVEAVFGAGGARATIGRATTVTGALCAATLSAARNATLACGGAIPSTSSTTTVTTSSSTTTLPSCGDGELDAGEECDPGSPGGALLLCDGRSCTAGCTCERPTTTTSTTTSSSTSSTVIATTTAPPTSSSTSSTTSSSTSSAPPTSSSTSSTSSSSTTSAPASSSTTTSAAPASTTSTSTTAAPASTSSTSTSAPPATSSSTSTILPTTTSSSSTSILEPTTSSTSSSSTTTSTQVPTTTTTSTTTSTTTITFPLNCGNGTTNAGETCDDANNSDNDACPSDCRIDACTPITTTQRFVAVHFAPPEGGLVAGLTMLFDYPEGSVDLPGNGTTLPSGTISGVPTGAFVSVNDLNFNMKGHAARITVGAGSALPPGQVVRLRFQDCTGATVPPASAFRCTVLTASDPFLNAVNGVTCSVVVQ